MLVERKGEDGVVRVTRVLLPRLSIVPSEEMDPSDCPDFARPQRRGARAAARQACGARLDRQAPRHVHRHRADEGGLRRQRQADVGRGVEKAVCQGRLMSEAEHDKHAALVSIGKHLGMFTDIVQMKAVYGVSDKPMSAEEWKNEFVREG